MGYPRVSLIPTEWPPGDQEGWSRANGSGGPLEAPGRAARWSPKTRTQVAKDHGRFLFWLRSDGRLDAATSPSARMSHENLSGYLSHLQASDMASTSLLSRLRNLRQAVWAMDPEADLRLISRLCSKLKARAEPVRDKHARVVPTPALVDAATKEYDRRIRSAAPMTARSRIHARDALMMMFLAYLPLRLDSFAGLRLGVHIVRQTGRYVLRLDSAEVKEDRPFDTVIPGALTAYLDHYIEEIRPLLLHSRQTDRFWVSTRGTGVSGSTLYCQVTKITKRLIGHRINPHAFRDCLLTTIATEAPECVSAWKIDPLRRGIGVQN